MTVERNKVVPVWLLGLLVALGSAGLALALDRAQVAAMEANHEARIQVLEKQGEQTYSMHLEILRNQGLLQTQMQQLIDRQDEVRRKLKIIQ